MTKEQSFVSADHVDLSPFMSSRTRERLLNAAIVQANISESFELQGFNVVKKMTEVGIRNLI